MEEDNANVVFVMEQDRHTHLDYFGDGVVHLSFTPEDGRSLRKITFEKLRGVPIRESVKLYTLTNGRFFSPQPLEKRVHILTSSQREIPTPEGHISTGFVELDRVLGGGLPVGSLIFLEERSGSIPHMDWMEMSILLSGLRKKMGVMWVPSQMATEQMARKYIPPEVFSSIDGGHLRILEVPTAVPSRFTAPVGGDKLYQELAPSQARYYLTKVREPFLYLIDLHSLHWMYSNTPKGRFINEMGILLSTLRASGYTTVFLYSTRERESMIDPYSIGIPHIHLVLERKASEYVIYGERPFLPYFLIVDTGEEGRRLDVIKLE